MKKIIGLFASAMMLLSFTANAQTCESDPRLDKVGPLVAAVKKGEDVGMIKITYHKYLNMHPKLKGLLGGGEGNPNFEILDHNCDPLIAIEGEFISKVEYPIEEIENLILEFQGKDDTDSINDLIRNVKARDVHSSEFIGWINSGRSSAYSKDTVCQLKNAGILKVGAFDNYGMSEHVSNCTKNSKGKLVTYSPYRMDLFAGFGGKITNAPLSSRVAAVAKENYSTAKQRAYVFVDAGEDSVFFDSGSIRNSQSVYAGNAAVFARMAPRVGISVTIDTWIWGSPSLLDDNAKQLSEKVKKIRGDSEELAEEEAEQE